MDKQIPIIGKRFQLRKKLGEGAFGYIREGLNIVTGQQVAIKFESVKADHAQLIFEANLLSYLSERAPKVAIPCCGVGSGVDGYRIRWRS